MSRLGHRKPASTHWKADAPKTSHYLMRILVQRNNWVIFIWKWARRGRYSQRRSLSSHLWTKIEEEDIGNIWFDQDGISALQPKLHSMFCALFLKLALSAAELMSFGHLGAVIWHHWTIICGVLSKITVTPTSQRQLTI